MTTKRKTGLATVAVALVVLAFAVFYDGSRNFAVNGRAYDAVMTCYIGLCRTGKVDVWDFMKDCPEQMVSGPRGLLYNFRFPPRDEPRPSIEFLAMAHEPNGGLRFTARCSLEFRRGLFRDTRAIRIVGVNDAAGKPASVQLASGERAKLSEAAASYFETLNDWRNGENFFAMLNSAMTDARTLAFGARLALQNENVSEKEIRFGSPDHARAYMVKFDPGHDSVHLSVTYSSGTPAVENFTVKETSTDTPEQHIVSGVKIAGDNGELSFTGRNISPASFRSMEALAEALKLSYKPVLQFEGSRSGLAKGYWRRHADNVPSDAKGDIP